MSDISITYRDPFPIIKRAVDKAADIVKPTFGPAGNKVIISKVTHGFVLDDGVQILRDLELPDPSENAVLKVVREVAIKTNDRAGDGTTGSVIMLQGIMDEVAELRTRDGHKIERELKRGLQEATEQLRDAARKVSTLEDLKKVARISYDNEEISGMIAETWHKVGAEGVVTVETTQKMETTSELSEGITLERGFISPYMVTNPERMEAIMEKAYILITDYRLTEAGDILPLLNKIAEHANKSAKVPRLVVIADNVEQAALATLVVNLPTVFNPQLNGPGKLQSIAIVAPSADREVTLEDIALLTGGRVFSVGKGDKLQDAKIEDLGQAERVISKKDQTVIVGPKGKASVIKKAIVDLQAAITTAGSQGEKEKLERRLAFFANRIAVIKVGAATPNEQKALKYKVEDAVNAVRVAYKGGVVSGGGLGLASIGTTSPLLNAALKRPHQQLLRNMSIELERPLKDGEALNVVTGKIGKWFDVGVVDPVDVLVAGLESAVSIASLLVTTSGMIVEKPKKIPQQG